MVIEILSMAGERELGVNRGFRVYLICAYNRMYIFLYYYIILLYYYTTILLYYYIYIYIYIYIYFIYIYYKKIK
jgi:hypothetical protein